MPSRRRPSAERADNKVRDGWWLALGTLTALPVTAPRVVDGGTARWCVVLSPLAVLPLGVLAGLACLLPLSPLPVAVVAVLLVVLASRALHVDGLADTADGLAASYSRERSLAVMRTGDVGPAGVAAVVLVLLAQVAGLATQVDDPVLVGVVVATSRWALLLTCLRGVPAARQDGLGVAFAGAVPHWLAALGVLAWAALVAVASGEWWRGAVAVLVAVSLVGLLVRRTLRRIGGTSGDVMGAGVEIALAAQLVALS